MSLQNLNGVHSSLVQVVRRAAMLTKQPFQCTCGVRSDAAQLDAWRRKTSKLNGIPIGKTVGAVAGTGRGNHQVSLSDGLGHAVDLVPYIDGVILWTAVAPADQWKFIYPVADAMQAASVELGINVRWGGVWDLRLNDLHRGAAMLETDVAAYKRRHAGPDFIDGPHFELA